jgi:hypothetical protein
VDASREWCVALIDAGKFSLGFQECDKLRKTVRAGNGKKDSVTELKILEQMTAAMKRANRKETESIDKEWHKMAESLGLRVR